MKSVFIVILALSPCLVTVQLNAAEVKTFGSNDVYAVVEKAATEGVASAQYEMGRRFFAQNPPDSVKAVDWYRKAADQGLPEAQNSLGKCYQNGKGVNKDAAECVKWYLKAAEQGNAKAQYNLGYCYKYGHGVEKNLKAAVDWYRKSAEQDYAPAQCYLGECLLNGSGVEMDKTRAVLLYRKAAEQGLRPAQGFLAVCLENGQGVDKDIAQAVSWYKKAAAQGCSVSQAKCREYNVIWDVAPADALAVLTAAQVEELKAKSQAFKGQTLVFKSLYIGMPIKDAMSLLMFYLGYDDGFVKKVAVQNYPDGKWGIDEKSGLRVAASLDGNVTAFYLPKQAVEVIFDSKDVEVKSFMQTFREAYSLPEFDCEAGALEFFSKNSIVGKVEGVQPIASKLGLQEKWTATGKQGYSVTIYGAPAVMEDKKLRDLVMAGSVETIPSCSLIIRKINKGAFD